MTRTQRINEWRAHYNDKLKDIGFEVPIPKVGESVGGYRRRSAQVIADSALPQTQSFARMPWATMDFDIFKTFEPELYQHAVVEYRNPQNVPKGEMREIRKRLPNGQDVIEFVGQDNFCRLMGRPGRRVASFWTEQGPVGADGRYLRR